MTKQQVFYKLNTFANKTVQGDVPQLYFLNGYKNAEQLEVLKGQMAEFVNQWNNNPAKKTNIVIEVANFSPQIKQMVGLRVHKYPRNN